MSVLDSLLRAIRDGEFRAEDHSDATMQQAIREGLVDYDAEVVNGSWRSILTVTDKGLALLDDERAKHAAYQTNFIATHDADTVAASAELASLLNDQTNGG